MRKTLRKLRANIRYTLIHIIRSPIKTLLTASFAALAIFALNYLQHVIDRNEAEIDRLFNTFVVHGEVVPADLIPAFINMRNVMFQIIVDGLNESDYVTHVYLEAGIMGVELFRYGEGDFYPIWRPPPGDYESWLLAVSSLEELIAYNMPRELDGAVGSALLSDYVGEFSVTFAPGFDVEHFVFNSGDETIPIIIHENMLAHHGFNLGDRGHIVTYSPTFNRLITVIGSYTGGRDESIGRFHRPLVIMPLDGMQSMIGRASPTYTTIRFSIDPVINRRIGDFREEMRISVGRDGSAAVAVQLILHDDVLHLVIAPLEQNLLLLRLLHPVALVLVFILAAGLAVMILLQSAKIAAIMRSLGRKKILVRLVLCGEYLVVCILGVILSLALTYLTGISFGMALVLPIVLYVIGAFTGAVTGAVLNTSRSPLELLQVRE